MPDIVLTTLNARYAHAAFGLRYLMANLGALRQRAVIAEFDINQRPLDVLEAILKHQPRIVGVGVYIWNVEQATKLVADLKRVAPEITIVLGGPEVSYEIESQEIVRLADYVITGEADLAFAALCRQLLAGERPLMKVIAADTPDLDQVVLPYDLYDERDIAHRVVYVEASRGCPFRCEFCLSSLDIPVRQFPLERFLAAMQSLLDRGCRQFKFVDRTFNLNLAVSEAILRFFMDRYIPGIFLHFEMIPDRFPEALRALVRQFSAKAPGALQFEVGVQSFNEEVCERISRRQDPRKVEENLRFLRNETSVHVHADLIVGLPGETIESFAAGVDRLVALKPQEIQVGILKRLRGTPIVRHDEAWAMVYSPHPPYEVLQTSVIDFPMMQRMRRFARYWDLVANSGNFVETTPMIWTPPAPAPPPGGAPSATPCSPFHSFLALSDWLHNHAGQTHGIALTRLSELLFRFLTESLQHDATSIATIMWRDFQRAGRSDKPEFLRGFLLESASAAARPAAGTPPRQLRHRLRG